MKKILLLITVLMCGLFIFTNMAFAGYQVNGGSISGSNGLYCETGEIFGGRPVYQLVDTDWELFYALNSWWIDDDGRGIREDCTYFNASTAATPPLSAWIDNINREALGPTLSEQACSSVSIPTLSEWGMIIMTLILASSAIWMMRRRQVL